MHPASMTARQPGGADSRIASSGTAPLPSLEEDPIWQMAGVDDYEPTGVDDVVYGLKSG
jgi:hypothetical protein